MNVVITMKSTALDQKERKKRKEANKNETNNSEKINNF